MGPLLGGLFADHLGLRATWAATVLILLGTGIVMAFVVREPPRTTEQPEPGVSPEEADARRRFLQRKVWLVIGLMALVRLANVAPNPVLPLFVQHLLPSPEYLGTTVGLMMAATGIEPVGHGGSMGRAGNGPGHRDRCANSTERGTTP